MNDSRSVANRKALKGRKSRRGAIKRKQQNKKRSFFNFKWILLVIVATVFLIMGGCSAVILAGNYAIDEDKLIMPQTSVFLDDEGKEFGQQSEEDREYVRLDEMPDYLAEAFIAVEDRRFYNHYGIDPRSVARAVWVDIKTGSLKEGSSTITMQLARNVFLTNEKEFSRKIKEAMIAINLEQNYTKEQILEMYLNQILFGHGKYGVETAANWYFDKTARIDGDKETISLSEAALLAGIPKAPTTYSPKNNLDKAIERRNLVLNLMEENGFITKEQKEEAIAEEVVVASHEGKGNKYTAYLDFVRREAKERFDLDEDELNRGGFKIYTNLNRQAQESVEKAYSNDDLFPVDGEYGEVQSGLTMLDPKTGKIVAVAGGRNYEAGNFNRSTANVQVGSAMKPLVTYAPAIEYKGMQPYDTVIDEPIELKGELYPKNAGGRYHGATYMVEAVKHSYNAAAVRTLKDVGVKNGYNFATNLGMTIDEKYNADDMYSLTLGANEASTVEMAQAYSAFANQGVLVEAHAISKIEYPDGSRVKVDEPQVKEVMSPRTAYYMTEMLKAVVDGGTGTQARIPGREVAGKTGTTNDSTRIWFVGYTPQYVTAIYMGRDEDQKHAIGESSGGPRGPAHLFSRVMAGALEGLPAEAFPRPEGVKKPQEPVKLTKVTDLRASYDEEAQTVSLSWTANDKRVKYHVYRLIGDENNASLIGEANGGNFTDSDIEVPDKSEGGLAKLFGMVKEQTYHYYVVPVNAETGETGEESNTATVVISPPEAEEPEEDDEEDETGDEPPNDTDDSEGPPDNDEPRNEDGDKDNGDDPGDGDNDRPDDGDEDSDDDGGEDEGEDEEEEEEARGRLQGIRPSRLIGRLF